MKLIHVFFTAITGFAFTGKMQAQSYTGPVNYVKSWDLAAPVTNAADVLTRPNSDVKLTTQYIDGLARPMQTVVRKGSLETGSTPKDMVAPQQYDQLGREVLKYLPYAEASANDGSFKTSAFTSQATFMSATYGAQGETWYYGQTDFEASPLNRPAKQMAAGNSWVGSGRGVGTKYWNNTSIDAVKKWDPGKNANELPFVSTAGTTTGDYAAGELVKTITVDEHGKQVIEFKDKDGKIILKKVQLTAQDDDGSGKDHTDWLCTYYLYDIYNNLRCIVQPKGVELLAANSWNLDALGDNIQTEQCFLYAYDKYNRMTIKKVPGAGEVRMVYDKNDRLVMVQDANLRTGTVKWLVTKYDNLNRPVETGLWTDNTTFATHLSSGASNSTYPTTSVGYEPLTLTHYDNYTGLPSGLSSYNSTLNSTYFEPTDNVNHPYEQMPAYSSAVKGLVAWTQTKVLGTVSTFLNTVTYYDAKGRVIQVQSTNLTGGTDIMSTQYTWAGQPYITIQQQQNSSSGYTTVIVTKYSYDELGRVTRTEKKQSHPLVSVGGTAGAMSAYKTIADNEYDKLGQLKNKKLAPGYGGSGLETLTYDYNIRGWMLGINRWYARNASNPTGTGGGYFGFDLGYDKTSNDLVNSQQYTAPQYNGNITGMVWRSKGDGEIRKYDFGYDAANRFMRGLFSQYSSGSFGTSTVNYTVLMGDGYTVGPAYDANGNIKRMQQWGLKLNGSEKIDDLGYTYEKYVSGITEVEVSNKLARVMDAITADNKLGDFKDGSSGAATDYTYDVNGNLSQDNNKAISSITYNHLNLPSVITVTGKGTITYTYDAAGNKLRKVTNETSATVVDGSNTYNNINIITTTDYIAGVVFESKSYSGAAAGLGYTNKLQFAGHEEGRIRGVYNNTVQPHTLTDLAYDYMIKDHLGNVRMVLTDENKQIFYPATTMEGTLGGGANSMVNFEKGFYRIDDTKIVSESAIPSWGTETTGNTKLYYNNNGNPPANLNYPSGASPTQTDGSSKLYKLNATTNRTGLDFVIKVMAGDKIDILGNSYHNNTGTINNSNSTPLNLAALMASMLLSPTSALAGKGLTEPILSGINTGQIPASFFRGANGETTTTPKAFINYIFLDEQFKYAGGGASRVGTNGVVKRHWYDDAVLQNITVPKNGYIFVYVSNESNVDVFFDNLQVIHKPGPVLEETHYYPFGLTMSGISSKAAGRLENKIKYNNMELQSGEFADGSGLEMYEYKYRFYDQQIGRFISQDRLADKYPHYSLYQFAGNQVPNAIDLDGLEEFRVNQKDGYKDVSLVRVDAPFSVHYNGQQLAAFPQQNMNDFYQNNVIVIRDPNSSSVSSVTVLNDDGTKNTYFDNPPGENGVSEPVYTQSFENQKEIEFQTFCVEGTAGNTLVQSNSVDKPKSNSNSGNVPAGTDMVEINYSSMGSTPSTFNITTTNPDATITTKSYTGTAGVGAPAMLPIAPGTIINVTVAPGAANSNYQYSIRAIDTNKPIEKKIPIQK